MSINSKFFSLDYLEDFSRRLEQIASFQRLKTYYTGLKNYSVGPSSTLKWFSLSGSGRLVRSRHSSRQVTAPNIWQRIYLEGVKSESSYGLVASVGDCYFYNIRSEGEHSKGVSGIIIQKWDDTNKIYTVRHMTSICAFLESIELEIENYDSSATGNEYVEAHLLLPTASKSYDVEMIAPKMPKIEHLNEIRNEFKLHHIVMCLSKQGKGKGAKNQYKLTINAPDSFRDKNLYKVVEKIQKAVK